jgi:hypothetical protein
MLNFDKRRLLLPGRGCVKTVHLNDSCACLVIGVGDSIAAFNTVDFLPRREDTLHRTARSQHSIDLISSVKPSRRRTFAVGSKYRFLGESISLISQILTCFLQFHHRFRLPVPRCQNSSVEEEIGKVLCFWPLTSPMRRMDKSRPNIDGGVLVAWKGYRWIE